MVLEALPRLRRLPLRVTELAVILVAAKVSTFGDDVDPVVNVPLLVAVPPGVTTEMVPVVPEPTTAVIWVSELTV